MKLLKLANTDFFAFYQHGRVLFNRIKKTFLQLHFSHLKS
jgi:hypothetical protein